MPRLRAHHHRSQLGQMLGPQPPQQQQPQPTPQPGADPYNTSTDPALMRIQAAMQQAQANADAQAIQARNQLAIDYGDPSLAADEGGRSAARANPFSRAATLAKERVDAPRAIDNSDSQSNLFYSSAHGQHQSELARALLGEEASNRTSAQQGLSTIEQGRLGSMSDWQDRLAQAQQDAADRAQQRIGDLPVGGQPDAPGGGAGHYGGGVAHALRGVGLRAHHVPRHRPRR